jgi:hypothetical protein
LGVSIFLGGGFLGDSSLLDISSTDVRAVIKASFSSFDSASVFFCA